mmetsp:Transcript_52390/g.113522  ORF Transcript_52390/g.113522 Transcript_52390/m.113522 type:complete len:207 (+) Transcript_52390:828-1448(+)
MNSETIRRYPNLHTTLLQLLTWHEDRSRPWVIPRDMRSSQVRYHRSPGPLFLKRLHGIAEEMVCKWVHGDEDVGSPSDHILCPGDDVPDGVPPYVLVQRAVAKVRLLIIGLPQRCVHGGVLPHPAVDLSGIAPRRRQDFGNLMHLDPYSVSVPPSECSLQGKCRRAVAAPGIQVQDANADRSQLSCLGRVTRVCKIGRSSPERRPS